MLVDGPDLLFDFAFSDEESFDVVFQFVNVGFDFCLDDGLGLLNGFDIMVFVLAYMIRLVTVDHALGTNTFAFAIETKI